MTPSAAPHRRQLRTRIVEPAAAPWGQAVEAGRDARLLWTLSETAQALGVSVRTARRLAPRIGFVRCGGVRLEPGRVLAWIERNRVGGRP